MSVRVEHGDCRDVIRTLADCSIHACVTDPPYALVSIVKRFGKPGSAPAQEGADGRYRRASAGFMGKQWDTGETAFDPAFWSEVLRVMKPGAHLVAFGGTRSYHRLACAIEDAGFEIRDTIFYCYGSGFPKSHSVERKLDEKEARCTCDKDMRGLRIGVDSADTVSSRSEQDVQSGLCANAPVQEDVRRDEEAARHLFNLRRSGESPAPIEGAETQGDGPVLQPALLGNEPNGSSSLNFAEGGGGSQSGCQGAGGATRTAERSVEGRGDLPEASRQLRERAVREMPARIHLNGESGRLCDGASPRDGAMGGATTESNGGGSPRRSQPAEQCGSEEPGAVAGQPEPQTLGAWPLCRGCGKPIVPDGLGTALKPAAEPIVLARKPLSGTVAANVLRHGTGALNIDGCRVPVSDAAYARNCSGDRGHADNRKREMDFGMTAGSANDAGRWPANVILSYPEDEYLLRPDVTREQKAALYRWMSENT